MFSPWIFKKKIFGIDVNIEFDFWGSIFGTWQKIYEFRLKRIWSNNIGPNFMKYALRYLPNGSFIIFSFNNNGDEFVQFMKAGTSIILDIPVWGTNLFYGKKKELSEIFQKAGIKKRSIHTLKQGRGGSGLRVDFGNHNAKASGVATEICQEIYGIKEPAVIRYETHRLVPKPKA